MASETQTIFSTIPPSYGSVFFSLQIQAALVGVKGNLDKELAVKVLAQHLQKIPRKQEVLHF